MTARSAAPPASGEHDELASASARRTCRCRDVAFLIETRSTIPQNSRDCERRTCATSNKLATRSEREPRCGGCDMRERGRVRASPTAPHDKYHPPPRVDETSKVRDERAPARVEQQAPTQATAVSNGKRMPPHQAPRGVGARDPKPTPNHQHPTTNSQCARAPCRRHTAHSSTHRQIAQLAHVIADQGENHHRPTKSSSPMRAATKKESGKNGAPAECTSDGQRQARARTPTTRTIEIEDDRCKQRPRPQQCASGEVKCHWIAVRTCGTHGHRHTNTSAPQTPHV